MKNKYSVIQCTILNGERSIKEERGLNRVLCGIIISTVIFLASPVYPALTGADMEMLGQVFQKGGFSNEEVEPLLRDRRLTLYPEIVDRKEKGINYLHPRFGLLSRSSIDRGRRVLKEHGAMLKSIEASYGVPREVLVAIYRVETNLGSNLGQYRVFNSLLTLTVMVNRRSVWAAQELIDLLSLCNNNRINPFSIRGSPSGAFGLCQFVPSSYLTYGTDGNGDGVVDLFDFSDAMASTANYLRSHGWHRRDARKQFRAIWAYNHCENYVKAVLCYSKQVKVNNNPKLNPTPRQTERPKDVRGKGLTHS